MPKKSSSVPSNNARERIAVNLQRLRKQRGVSQERLGEAANFHRTYISQLERRLTNVSIDGLERIAKALGVDVRDLLTTPK